ncbi:MAG: FtsB family cell division protein [Bacteroidota bacterium]|jgi:cell division protein DivIC
MKKLLEKIPRWMRNRFVIVFAVFVVWMTFFDRNNLVSQWSYRQELKKLEQDKAYYKEMIEENAMQTVQLKSDPKKLEKFAREKYLMKKDNEDIFLIVEE